MGKKRKNVPTLQDLLDRPICYYCEKDFEDLNYLVDHMKAKHYKCDKCGRRLTTAGGLGVHMSQVHKEKLEKVANALPDREKPDIEIFGMEGFPKHLLETHHRRLTSEYFKREAEHRKNTGNPTPGGPAVPVNPQKKETMEETKQRLAEHKAKREAEKAAAAAAAANGEVNGTDTPPITGETMDISSTQQDPPPQSDQEPDPFDPSQDYIRLKSEDMYLPATTAAAAYLNVTPMPGQPTPGMAFQPTYPNPAMHMPSRGPNPAFGGGSFPPKPSTPGYAGPPLPHFPPSQGSPTSSLASVPRQTSLPSAPGLPQRPAFDSPNISKEDMARMHIPPGPSSSQPMHYNNGQVHPAQYGPPAPQYSQYGVANSPYGAPYPSNGPSGTQYGMPSNGMPAGPWYPPSQEQLSSYIGDQVDELIQSVTGERPPSTAQPPKQEPNRLPTPEPKFPADSDDLAVYAQEQVNLMMIDKTTRDEMLFWADPVRFSTDESIAMTSEVEMREILGRQARKILASTPEPISTSGMAETEAGKAGAARADATSRADVHRDNNGVSSSTPELSLRTEKAHREAEKENAAPAPSKPSKKSKHAKDNVKMLWSDKIVSPEEKRAKKYYVSRPKPTETIIDQPGEEGQEVTGAVDDVYEQ